MALHSLLCQLMHNSLLQQPATVFTNTLKNIDVYSGQSHFYTSILRVHQMVGCWQGASSFIKRIPHPCRRPVENHKYCCFSVCAVPTDSHSGSMFCAPLPCSVLGGSLLQTASPGPLCPLAPDRIWLIGATSKRWEGRRRESVVFLSCSLPAFGWRFSQ